MLACKKEKVKSERVKEGVKDVLYTIKEAANKLSVSTRTVHRLIDFGALESIKVLRSTRITSSSLHKVIEEGYPV